jgi:hypothetical protein
METSVMPDATIALSGLPGDPEPRQQRFMVLRRPDKQSASGICLPCGIERSPDIIRNGLNKEQDHAAAH